MKRNERNETKRTTGEDTYAGGEPPLRAGSPARSFRFVSFVSFHFVCFVRLNLALALTLTLTLALALTLTLTLTKRTNFRSGAVNLIYIEFHVAMNFDKLTKNFPKFQNGPLIRGVFKVFFFVFFIPGVAWAQGPQAATPRMKKKP